MVPIFLHAQIQLNNQWGFGGSDEEFLIGLNKEENILLISSRSGVSGNKTLPSFGSQDAWILKLKQDGSIDKELVLGGSNPDYPVGLVKHGEHYFVALNSFSDISGNKTMNDYGTGLTKGDIWLVKLNSQFQLIDQWVFGTDSIDGCQGVFILNENILMYGHSKGQAIFDKSENSRGGVDAWVICVDTLGNKLWDKTYGGAMDDNFYRAQILDDGIIFVGNSNSDIGFEKSENSFGGTPDIWVVKTDFLGNIIWDKTYGDFDFEALCNIEIIDSKLLITGYNYGISSTPGNLNLSKKGDFDGFLVQVNLLNPSLIQAKSFGGSDWDNLVDVKLLSQQNYLVLGSTNSLNGDLSGISPDINGDFWISILDTNFNIVESVTLGSSNIEVANFLYKTSERFFVAGQSLGGISGDKTTPNHGLEDVWLLEISHPLSIDNKTPSLFFEIYPNPTSDVLYFRELNNQFSTLEVVDIQGRVQHSMQIEGNTGAELSISNLNPGTYIAKLQLKNGMWVSKKFVKL